MSGLYVPKTISEHRKPTAFSLFSGAGGMDLGFIMAGWHIVGANEYDEASAITNMMNLGSYPINIHYIEGEKDKERLNKFMERHFAPKNKLGIMRMDVAGSGWIKNHPEASATRDFWFGDVRKLKGADVLETLGMEPGEIDCVFGGPPCQGYSYAGKRDIADPRNNLVYEFARIITELQPKTFVMENVPGIATMLDTDGVPVLDKFCMLVSEGGYGRWDMLKKALLMQAGAAAGIKSPAKIKNDPDRRIETDMESAQMSMFDELEVAE